MPKGIPGSFSLCTIEGCAGVMHAGGLCGPHYVRRRRHGDPTVGDRDPVWRILNRQELAWAAGFFDGEGSIVIDSSTKHVGPRSYLSSFPFLTITQHQDVASLRRFREAVGVGKIVGPYPYRTRPEKHPASRYVAKGLEPVQAVCAAIWPWIGAYKREQITSVLTQVRLHREGLILPKTRRRNTLPGGKTSIRSVRSAAPMDSVKETLAWAAGFFDAEGWFALGGSTGIVQANDVALLHRFRDAVGVGKVRQPPSLRWSPEHPTWKARWKFTASARADVSHVAATLWPWLGEAKRGAALRMFQGKGWEWTIPCEQTG